MHIPDSTKIQSIDLSVRDLDIFLNFYSTLLGFKVIERHDGIALLSASGSSHYLIKLIENKIAKVRVQGTSGLYHIAFRFPNRKELARVFLRLFNNKIKFQGFSDHLVSEAIYLGDPDGNGIELYVDRPKDTWEWKFGQVQMDLLPLDLSKLTNELDNREVWSGIHPQTEIGHIHLNVSDLSNAEKFYNEIIGFNVSNSSYPGAMFFSAGGYHHHVGTNVWSTKRGLHSNPDSLGLRKYTIKIPDKDYLKSVEEKARQSGLLENQFDGTKLEVNDFDGNRIYLSS